MLKKCTNLGLGQQQPLEQEPEFLQPLDNLTVTQGRDVQFTCVVNNLGQYKVSLKSEGKRLIETKLLSSFLINSLARFTFIIHNENSTTESGLQCFSRFLIAHLRIESNLKSMRVIFFTQNNIHR